MTSSVRFAVALLAGVMLAVCTVGASSASSHGASRYGGTLVVGMSGGDADNLDPTVSRSSTSQSIYRVMCQRLYDLDSNLQLLPLLAAAPPVLSKDKLSYAVELRKGLLFNDGTPFNAQAVVATTERFMTYPGSARASDYADVASVTASGPYTVVYHLKARDSTFFNGLLYVLSPTALASEGNDFATHPVCVGPFMFDHRVVGDNVTVIKSPYYFDHNDIYLDKIVFKSMPDAAAAVAALEAGDIQALDQVSSTEIGAVQHDSSLKVISHYQLGWQGIVINVGNKNGLGNLPYSNVGSPLAASVTLRQAFEEAIDRNAMNRVVFGGLFQPSCTPIAPADSPWFDATKVPCTPYDPADARKLVAASGFPKPTVHLLVPSTTDVLRLAQFVQAQESAVGIAVVIDTVDPATLASRQISGSFETTFSGFVPGGPDPNGNIYSTVATSGVRNFGGYSNPRLDLVLSNGLKATSIQPRSILYHVAQQIIESDRPIIVLYNAVRFAAFSTSLSGLRLEYNGKLTIAYAHYR